MAFLMPDKVHKINGVTVKEYHIAGHNPNKIAMPSKRTTALEGVTIHNTGIITVKGTTMAEQYTRATVNGNMKDVRVHYYVDDVEAWQNLPENWQSWHAGQKGKPEANGSEAGNASTISIECIMGGAKGYEKAEDNAARLAAYILHTNGLGIEKLYTHNYWCNVRNGVKGTVDELNTKPDGYKGCPVYIRPHWEGFKMLVQKYMDALNASKKMYYVQVGAFSSKVNAEKYLAEVKKIYPNAFIKEF